MSIASLKAGMLATKVYVGSRLISTSYNDSNFNRIVDLARIYAYEQKVEKYANLDVLLNEYIDVGWLEDDSDRVMTPDKLGQGYAN